MPQNVLLVIGVTNPNFTTGTPNNAQANLGARAIYYDMAASPRTYYTVNATRTAFEVFNYQPGVTGPSLFAQLTDDPMANVLLAGYLNGKADATATTAALAQKADATATTAALANRVLSAAVGAANGVVPLDGSIKIPLTYIPSSLLGALVYQSTWNAANNTPDLVTTVAPKGQFWKVSTAGTTSLPGGQNSWNVGDIAISNGTTYDKVDGIPSEVLSVLGNAGAVTLAQLVAAGVAPASTTPSKTQTFTKTFNVSAPVDGLVITVPIEDGQTVTKMTGKTTSGSCTVTAAISGTNLTGTPLAASSTKSSQTYAAANVAVAGNDLTFTISGSSAPVGLAVTYVYTKSLT